MENSSDTQRVRKILGVIEKIIFKAEDNDNVILSVKLENGKSRKVVGALANPVEGAIVLAAGLWRQHQVHSWEFVADSIIPMCKDPEHFANESLSVRVDEVFGAKPIALVHNKLESWSARLLALVM